MSTFLEKLKIKQHFTTEIETEKNTFYTRFSNQVDKRGLGFFSNYTDIFSSSKNQYKGYVGYDDFKIKRKSKLFNMNMNMAVANGSFYKKGEKLTIETTVNSFSTRMIPFYVFILFFYSAIFAIILSGNMNTDGTSLTFIFPFLILHAALMFGVPYYIMRKSTSNMLYELEREFFYLTK